MISLSHTHTRCQGFDNQTMPTILTLLYALADVPYDALTRHWEASSITYVKRDVNISACVNILFVERDFPNKNTTFKKS